MKDQHDNKTQDWLEVTMPLEVAQAAQASGANGGVTREEILWINPQAEKQGDLFGGGV